MEFCSWQRGSQPEPLIFPALNEFEICFIEKGKGEKTPNPRAKEKRFAFPSRFTRLPGNTHHFQPHIPTAALF